MDNKLKRLLYAHVTRKGACGHGISEIENAKSIDDLVDLLLMPDSVSHCAEFEFPPLSVMKPYEQMLRLKNVFLSGENSATNAKSVLIFGGNIELTFDQLMVSEVYVTGGASVTVNASNYAYVMVVSYHGAQVTINNKSETSKVLEVKHG